MRRTKETGYGSDTFIFKWGTPASLQSSTDSQIGYEIDVKSQRAGFSNGVSVYISQNKFVKDGQQYILDNRALFSLAGGQTVAVTWTVTIVKTSDAFYDSNPTQQPNGLIRCGPPSQVMNIELKVE